MQTKKIIKYLIFTILIILLNLITNEDVQAVAQVMSTDINSIDNNRYPGIQTMIKELQVQHPKWNFKVLYTGLTWEEVIANEYVGHNASPRNLVTSSHTGEWQCSICGDKAYDNGSWRCASEMTLKYMIDPRNSVNNSDLFQFLELTYTECDYNSIYAMVKGTFLENESYINTIITVAKDNNVSAYYIVALILQEQGSNGSSTISGTYAGYEGYYNIFNINAIGNGSDTIIKNALAYAKSKDWTTIEKSIAGGVERIAESYIARGQNTLYFQKFDVENSDGNLYWHQYQQNALAAQNEGVKIRKIFENINSIDASYTFIIPLYENMPAAQAPMPKRNTNTNNTVSTDIVKVNVSSSLTLRDAPNGNYLGRLTSGEIVTRLEKAITKVNGTYWDKVMKSNGTIGYAARETYETETEYKLYLVPINDMNQGTDSNVNNDVNNNTNNNNNTTGNINNNDSNIENSNNENVDIGKEEALLTEIKTTEINVDNTNKIITIVPGVSVQSIIDETKNEVTVKDTSGNLIGNTATPGTGYVVNDIYTVVLTGDANGDGKINSGDLFSTQKYLISQNEITESVKKAMDVNLDNKINSGDLFYIQKYLLGNGNFEIQ